MKMTPQERLQKSERLRQVKRKVGSTKKYFTKENEEAIKTYILSSSFEERERLFSCYIYPVFLEIINNIVNVYKFNYLPNLDDRKMECVRLLSEKIGYFDPNLGFKAFSYFSVITKNWWLNEAKKFKKEAEDLKRFEEDFVFEHSGVYETEKELIRMEEWGDEVSLRVNTLLIGLRENTNLYKVAKEVINLLETYQKMSISSYNRKAVVQHISYKTGLHKQQVMNSLYRLKKIQSFLND